MKRESKKQNTPLLNKIKDILSRGQWVEKTVFVLLLAWVLLPIWSIILHYYWEYGKTPDFMDLYEVHAFYMYQNAVQLLGEVSAVVVVLYLIGEICYRRKDFFSRLKKTVWNIALLAMLFWAGIATIFSTNIERSLMRPGYNTRYEGYFTYIFYACVVVIAQLIKNEKYKIILYRVFSSVGCVISILVIMQDANVSIVSTYFLSERAAVFEHFNHLGYYLCMTILSLIGLYVFEKKLTWKIYYAAGIFLQMYALFVNSTFGGYLGVLVGLSVMILFAFFGCKGRKNVNRIRLGLIVPIVIVLLTTFMSYMEWIPTSSGETMRVNVAEVTGDAQNLMSGDNDMVGHGRMTFWKVGIEMIAKRPILGYGPENSDPVLMAKIWGGRDRIANEVIQYAVFIGIPGVMFYLFALISLLINRVKNIRKVPIGVFIAAGCVVGYFVSSMLGNSMFYTAPYYWMFLGIVAATINVNEPGKAGATYSDVVEKEVVSSQDNNMPETEIVNKHEE